MNLNVPLLSLILIFNILCYHTNTTTYFYKLLLTLEILICGSKTGYLPTVITSKVQCRSRWLHEQGRSLNEVTSLGHMYTMEVKNISLSNTCHNANSMTNYLPSWISNNKMLHDLSPSWVLTWEVNNNRLYDWCPRYCS